MTDSTLPLLKSLVLNVCNLCERTRALAENRLVSEDAAVAMQVAAAHVALAAGALSEHGGVEALLELAERVTVGALEADPYGSPGESEELLGGRASLMPLPVLLSLLRASGWSGLLRVTAAGAVARLTMDAGEAVHAEYDPAPSGHAKNARPGGSARGSRRSVAELSEDDIRASLFDLLAASEAEFTFFAAAPTESWSDGHATDEPVLVNLDAEPSSGAAWLLGTDFQQAGVDFTSSPGASASAESRIK